MKLLNIVGIAALIYSVGAEANGYTETLACDTCDYSKVQQILQSEFPVIDCQGDVFDPSYQCDDVSRTLMIVNPDSRQAWKYKLTASMYGNQTRSLSISSAEQNSLNTLYGIYDSLESALERNNVFDANGIFTGSSMVSASTSADCSNHPTNYFKSNEHRRVYEGAVGAALLQRMGNRTFDEFYSDEDVYFSGLTLGADGAGISVQWKFIEKQHTALLDFDRNNYLLFQVLPIGDTSTFNVRYQFRLLSDRSAIDGERLDRMIAPGGEIFLDPEHVSNCMKDFIEGRDLNYQEPPFPGAPGVTAEPIGTYNGIGMCRIKRTGLTSIVGSGRPPRIQDMSWITACPL